MKDTLGGFMLVVLSIIIILGVSLLMGKADKKPHPTLEVIKNTQIYKDCRIAYPKKICRAAAAYIEHNNNIR